jgi:formate-dependent nitrite reductase membrane component NrfD
VSGAPGDGRNVDPRLGALIGEAAGQAPPGRAAPPPEAPPAPRDGGSPTYYDRPVIKPPVWKRTIAAYFWLGGAAGAAATLGAVAQLAAPRELRGLVVGCRRLTAVAGAASTAILIDDLGRPERFLNMLRVVRPSSPMSVGAWVLAGLGSAAAPAAALAGAGGRLGRAGDAAGLAAGALGMPLAGYTAVLLNNTVVPVWYATHRTLPPFFVASGTVAATGMLELTRLSAPERRVVHRLGVAARVADVLAARAVDREAGRVERVARPLRTGASGALWRAASAMTAASLALGLLPRRARGARRAGAALGALASLAARVAIFQAGVRSARDPRATFELQRAGLGGASATGRAAVAGPGGRRATE